MIDTIKLNKITALKGMLLIEYQTFFLDKDMEVFMKIKEIEKPIKPDFSDLIGFFYRTCKLVCKRK
jgi:hypothetical protein